VCSATLTGTHFLLSCSVSELFVDNPTENDRLDVKLNITLPRMKCEREYCTISQLHSFLLLTVNLVWESSLFPKEIFKEPFGLLTSNVRSPSHFFRSPE